MKFDFDLNVYLEIKNKLTHLQRRILQLRFGLDGCRRHSLKEVSEVLELSVSDIRAEERQILKILRLRRKPT